MEIIRSKYLGPCHGVLSACSKVKDMIKNNKKKIILENIIAHNEIIMSDVFENQDFELLNAEKNNINADDLFIISAHGHDFSFDVNGYDVLDCTCSYLNQRLDHAIKIAKDSRVLYLGKQTHPETKFTLSKLKNEKIKYLYCINVQDIIDNYKQGDVIIIQSTYLLTKEGRLKKLTSDEKLFLTCPFVYNRFIELESVNAESIIVIGSRSSSNSTALFAKAKDIFANAYFIENLMQLNDIINYLKAPVFITSGTSTPLSIISEIEKVLTNKT